MKKQILPAVITLLVTSTVFATLKLPETVRLSEDKKTIFFNESISCYGYSAENIKITQPTQTSFVLTEFTSAYHFNNVYYVSGKLDGDIFHISADPQEGYITFTLYPEGSIAEIPTLKSVPLHFSSSGSFSKNHKVVSLRANFNNRSKFFRCMKIEQPAPEPTVVEVAL